MAVMIFASTRVLSAQDAATKMKHDHQTMQNEDMQKCMDKIMSDDSSRDMMMQKMLDHAKNDSTSMKKMSKMMMMNPEMHKMMMKMMNGGKMMDMQSMDMKMKNQDSMRKCTDPNCTMEHDKMGNHKMSQVKPGTKK